MIYIIGSLSNPKVIEVANKLKEADLEEFSQWMASGPEADSHWKNYGALRGWTYMETLRSAFVQTAFSFDYSHMQKADTCVLVMPAGKSAHCEFGWFIGSGRKGYILFDGEPDRPDLMPPNLATGIFFNIEDLIKELTKTKKAAFIEYDPSKHQLPKIVHTHNWICGSYPDLCPSSSSTGRK